MILFTNYYGGIFCTHFYSKRVSVAENIHEWNVKLSGATFLVTVNIYTRYFTLRDCPYKR